MAAFFFIGGNMEQKKYLDANGVGYLYKKLSLEDYPNNETLATVIDAMQSTLDEKANIDSPSLTGVPTAPTAAVGTSTQQLATTEFVMQAIDDLDGDATASDILKGKFAYVNGQRVDGTLETVDIYIGTGIPDDSIGSDGDFYVMESAGDGQ